jgi:hypothetical protein
VTKESEIENSIILKNFMGGNMDNSYRYDRMYIENQNTPVYDALLVARNLFD